MSVILMDERPQPFLITRFQAGEDQYESTSERQTDVQEVQGRQAVWQNLYHLRNAQA
jgi:hypothetical protein